MSLYINGVVYSSETSLEKFVAVMQQLPSPLPDIREDFDPEINVIKAVNPPHCTEFLISPKKETAIFNSIAGKNGNVFSEESSLDHSAYYVHQGSVGLVTIGKKIGTADVADCVALIIQDKKIKTTALAHIDTVATEKDIQNILAILPEGDKEAILIGGQRDVGKHNVNKILKVLAGCQQNIFIHKSYVCHDAHVYDNQSFFSSCYKLNTAKGDIIVDTTDLSVKPGYATIKLPTPSPNECKENQVELDAFCCSLSKIQDMITPTSIDSEKSSL